MQLSTDELYIKSFIFYFEYRCCVVFCTPAVKCTPPNFYEERITCMKLHPSIFYTYFYPHLGRKGLRLP